MKRLAAAIVSLSLISSLSIRADQKPMQMLDDVGKVAPALEKYTQGRLLEEVWKRPGLSPRDRGIVTLAALIARNQTVEMPSISTLRSITASSHAKFPRSSRSSPSMPAGPTCSRHFPS